MTLNEMYSYIDERDIFVFNFPMNDTISLSMPSGKHGCIGIDENKLQSQAEEMCILGHECGHCETGSFYNGYSPFDIRQKHENRADRWAILKFVPKNELEAAIKDGIRTVWELADCFNVTNEFMFKVLNYYQHLEINTLFDK